jgi:hypothetical protein
MEYEIVEHKHRFAAWAASRAASAKNARFTVETGKAIIEELGLKQLVDAPDALPLPTAFDAWHIETCKSAMEIAQRIHRSERMINPLQHGSAAKLVNMYLKIIYSCGGHENHARVAAIHPPIDNLLLDELKENDKGYRLAVWKKARKMGWSKFNQHDYLEVIETLKDLLQEKPLWMAEAYWRGHQ